jgi:pimeloyl-ACP methyl ester carboxylesterase
VGIAYFDLGGTGPVLLLAHATGFCGAVLAPLADRLGRHYRCIAFDERAHGSSGRPPGEDFGWYGFAADVLAVVDHLGLDQPVAFGHSCGAAALLLAEQARPGTFGALYCYEPIVYPDDAPLPPSLEANPLAAGALRRREVFASRDDALTNFSTKTPFDRLHPDVLAAYVDNGFAPDPAGIRLRCRRQDEAQVYAHGLAHDAFAHLDEVRCPVTLACGAETDAIGPDVLALCAARLPGADVVVLPGLGHFGPMEDPDALTRSVASTLGRSTGTPGA